MTTVARYFLRSRFSIAEMFGFGLIAATFDLTQWWLAIPLLAAWIFACLALADRVGAA